MNKNDILIQAALESSDFSTIEDMFENAVYDSVATAICIECGLVTEMEGDQREGYCEGCGENKVKSVLVLAELI